MFRRLTNVTKNEEPRLPPPHSLPSPLLSAATGYCTVQCMADNERTHVALGSSKYAPSLPRRIPQVIYHNWRRSYHRQQTA